MHIQREYLFATVTAEDVMTGRCQTFGVEYCLSHEIGVSGNKLDVQRITYPWGTTVRPCSEQFTEVEDCFHMDQSHEIGSDRIGRDLDPSSTDNPDALRFHG